jgi:sugar phosphate isomerase/epimerase
MDTSRLSTAADGLAKDFRQALRRARDLGLQGVEIDARNAFEPARLTQTAMRQLRRWLGDEGIVVSAVAFRTRGGYAEAERLEGRVAATKAALELARSFGADVVLNHVGDIPAHDDPRFAMLVGARLCVAAGPAAPADLARLVAALPDGALGCDLVTGALLVNGYDPSAAVATLADSIAVVHATDAVAGPFAGRGSAVVLGTGQVDLPDVLGTLEERGYRGWIGLEPVDPADARDELAAAIAHLRNL